MQDVWTCVKIKKHSIQQKKSRKRLFLFYGQKSLLVLLVVPAVVSSFQFAQSFIFACQFVRAVVFGSCTSAQSFSVCLLACEVAVCLRSRLCLLVSKALF